jgi:sugar phosphate permease
MVPVLGHERGLSASAIGAILGGFALTAAVIRLILPWVGRAWREWQLIAVAMLSSCVLLFIYPFMSQALSMGLLSAGLGIFLGMVQPMVVSMLHHISPEHRRGEALGLRLMAINASSAVMPMLMGVLGGALGVFGVFWSVSALVGLGARQCWHFKRLPQPE